MVLAQVACWQHHLHPMMSLLSSVFTRHRQTRFTKHRKKPTIDSRQHALHGIDLVNRTTRTLAGSTTCFTKQANKLQQRQANKFHQHKQS
jgi:hypothetical protein